MTRRLILQLTIILPLLAAAGCSPDVLMLPLSPDGVVLAFGDSLTAGNGAAADQSYPAQLARLLNREVVNAGVSGEISREGMQRLNALLDAHRPELLILCHGGNDLLRKLPQAELEANLLAMINMAHSRGIQVLLLGVPSPGIFLNSAEVYEKVAEATGVFFIPELIPDVLSEPALKSDTVHPNQAGYAEVANSLYAALQEFGAI